MFKLKIDNEYSKDRLSLDEFQKIISKIKKNINDLIRENLNDSLDYVDNIIYTDDFNRFIKDMLKMKVNDEYKIAVVNIKDSNMKFLIYAIISSKNNEYIVNLKLNLKIPLYRNSRFSF